MAVDHTNKQKEQPMLYQQGDVLLHVVKTIPGRAKFLHPSERGVVLAEGESTGHAHCIADTEHAELMRLDDTTYLNVTGESVVISHEEHGAIEVPPGMYRVERVREYDHFAEEARVVED